MIIFFSKEEDMKLTKILLMFLFLTLASNIYARRDSDDMRYPGGNDNPWVCSWCINDHGYGNGGMGINGYQDYFNNYRMDFENKTPRLEEPVTMDQARHLVDNYIYLSGDTDLKHGRIVEKDNEFDTEIMTKDGSPLGMLVINKQTGEIKSPF